MAPPVRKFASARVKPIVGASGWRVLRKLDVRGERERRRHAERKTLIADLTRVVTKKVEREQRDRARQNLTVLARNQRLTPPQRLVLSELEAYLTAKPRAKVALVGGPETETLALLITERFTECTVVVIPASSTASERHVRLAATGRHHVILATGPGDDPVHMLKALLFHLSRNGLLAITDVDVTQSASAGLLPLLTRFATLRARRGTPEGRAADSDERALSRAIRRTVLNDGYVVVENRTALMAKIREEEVPLLLSLREPSFGEVLVEREAQTFVSRCTIRDHTGVSTAFVREQQPFDVPSLQLREYADVTCGIGQVLAKDHLLLPETYRHNQRPRLRTRKVEDLAPKFGRPRDPLDKLPQLSGTYFYWDCEYPGHFGHVLTEQISRLWALDAARQRHPDLKVMFGRRYGHQHPLPFERAVLEAVGVEAENVQLNLGSVQVERVLAATPMLSMPEYVSPHIEVTWDFVGDRIAAKTTKGEGPRRIFCSRRNRKRSCRNASEVERLFASHGFEVLYPEELPLADQIVVFRNAEVVAGFAGSALFNLMFCPEPKPVIIVSSEAYTATNEYLIGAVRQHSFDVFWSPADTDSFQSTFVVDLDRVGRQIARHLTSLG